MVLTFQNLTYRILIGHALIVTFLGKMSMAKWISLVVGMGVFIVWIRLVGNPHVVETVIGLIFALGAGVFTYMKVKPDSRKS